MHIGSILKCIASYPSARKAVKEFQLKDSFDKLADKLNNYVHSNGHQFYNESYTRLDVKNKIKEECKEFGEAAIFITIYDEFLVNRFAVSIWQYAGYEQELNDLQQMINETLQQMKDPVPDHMSFTEYYEQIWGTEELMQVPIYGYFQFKSVQMALENREDLENVLKVYRKVK